MITASGEDLNCPPASLIATTRQLVNSSDDNAEHADEDGDADAHVVHTRTRSRPNSKHLRRTRPVGRTINRAGINLAFPLLSKQNGVGIGNWTKLDQLVSSLHTENDVLESE